ncbi:MAG: hypothetical protein M3P32_02320 [Chloroflexota bacterium]|nr:hypothetical protein [Chloroflexota bacterium]
MQPGFGSEFQPGLATGPSLAVELVSSHARIGGSVNLAAYTRLSDLLNFHDEVLTVHDGVVLNRTGIPTADAAPALDVRLEGLTIVIDRSDWVPPQDPDTIEKTPHRMLAVTQGHVITGTFFIYPGAEPVAYLQAKEPHWVPVTDVRLRSLVDRRIKFSAGFAVLNRRSVIATTVI